LEEALDRTLDRILWMNECLHIRTF
jgi:hypothetical protein